VSFDIFLVCVKDGETAVFKRDLFEEIFSRGAINPQLPFTNVVYGDGGAQIYGADEISRACRSTIAAATRFLRRFTNWPTGRGR
jgi:hypothetical protein